MNTRKLIIEFTLLFIALPIFLALPMGKTLPVIVLKITSVLGAFTYLSITLFKKTDVRWYINKSSFSTAFAKALLIKTLIIIAVTTAYVYFTRPEILFCVPRTDLKLWIIILFVYTFISVWPQELIYRTFFMNRYESLFKNTNLLIGVNAFVFMLAHLFFFNALVLALTFIGGILFALTYNKTKSTTLVSIEHAIYGNWLFTVGMGEMLAFPGMGSC